MKKFLVIFCLFVGLEAVAGATLVESFSEVMALDSPPVVQTLRMDTDFITYADTLKVHVEDSDLPIIDAGYGGGYFHLGLLDSEGYTVGWASNDNDLANQEPSVSGFLQGKYSSVLGYMNKPANVILVYDALDNGWHIDSGVVGSAQDLAEGDLFFWTNDMLFDGVRGDVMAFDPYGIANDYARIPSIVLSPIPEPATILFILGGGVLLRRKKGV